MLYKKGEDTKSLILNGSKKIFLSKGYKETTYKLIGNELNINPNLITYYFKDKKTLAQKILFDFFQAEYILIDSFSLSTESPIVNYAIQNRIHYQILADNPNILAFYKDVITSGFLNNMFMQIPYVKNMYSSFFTYYSIEKVYPDSYYSLMETGSEHEIIQQFRPELTDNELFMRFIVSIFPTFIGVPQQEILDALTLSKKLCVNLNVKNFEF